MLRVVALDGQLVVDERRRLPGPGAWVHLDPDCVSKAEKRRAFPRALRVRGVLNADGVRHHVERLVEQGGRGSPTSGNGTRKQVDPS